MTEVVIWTDFERSNTTHFWSPSKKVYMKPEEDPGISFISSFKLSYDYIYVIFVIYYVY